MRLRTQILILLLLFGLAPLLVAVVLNVPFIFEKLEGFYHRAHLLNLRADFRDLDQHLASRHETVRLLAKLSTSRRLVQVEGAASAAEVGDEAQWLGAILRDQVDIISVMFLDGFGDPVASYERDPHTQELVRRKRLEMQPLARQVDTALALGPGGVATGPVRINPAADIGLPSRYLVLQLVSPIFNERLSSPGDAVGAVVMSLDIGGVAQAYRNTYWAQADGRYIGRDGNAFADFEGLRQVFAQGELSLWKGPHGQNVIWVPLLATEQAGPIWAGREVDPSPIFRIMEELRWRIGVVVIGLVIMVLLIAHWTAGRMERFRGRLTEGVSRILERETVVSFDWRGPHEVRELGEKLTRLSERHVQNVTALRNHARELEAMNRHKSEFLANVSHELRTPLNSILLLSKLLADGDGGLSEEQRKQARVVHSAGTDLRKLIDDILDLSRIEARKTVLQVGAVALPALLEDLVELVRTQAEHKGLAITLRIEEEALTSVVSDADLVRRILKNFLANAIKFTERGRVEVSLGVNEGEDAQARPVRISVLDTGIGIPHHKHGVIFDAFQQADGSTSRRYGGTGLGLTISNELARLLGGRITLASDTGRGSVFSLLLPPAFEPTAEVQVEVVPSVVEEEEAEAMQAPDFSGRRVLVADHEVQNLLALTPLLESWNVEVVAAGSEDELWDELTDGTGFDLVVINPPLLGPEGSGLHHLLASDRLGPDTGVLVIGNPAEYARIPSDRPGIDFIGHPVDPARLEAVLGERWADGRSSAEVEAYNAG